MRRTCLLFLGGLFLLLSACAPNPSDGTEDSQTQIVATTYPVYLFACEVTRRRSGLHRHPDDRPAHRLPA